MLDRRLAERLIDMEDVPTADEAFDLASAPLMDERDIPDPFATPPPRTVS